MADSTRTWERPAIGPKPPVEDPAHNYHFQLFALDVPTLGLKPGAAREELLTAMKGHVLAAGEVVGTSKEAEKPSRTSEGRAYRADAAADRTDAAHAIRPSSLRSVAASRRVRGCSVSAVISCASGMSRSTACRPVPVKLTSRRRLSPS